MTGISKSFRIQDIIVHNADFLKSKFRENFVDLIITSPPYNIGIDYGQYDDNKTYQDYLEFSRLWLTKCYGILRKPGRICINVPLSTHPPSYAYGEASSIAADLTILAKRAGFKYKGTIIWNHSTPLMTSKHAMVFSRDIEVILILYKENWKPVKVEYKAWVNEIWQFSGESKKRVGHPAPFPVEIPRRLIQMFTEKDDVVMDPFVGSGTTMVACKLLGRKGIGVEISKEFFERAISRIENKI